jgi:hypothetical protein
MSAQNSLSSTQFNGYDLMFNKGDATGSHVIEAYLGKTGPVGHLEWGAQTGKVLNVQVEPDHQRKGLATAMWKLAQNTGVIKPVHSLGISDQGQKWKKSLK